MFAGFYGCVGTAVEIMREQMEQQLDELRLQEEEESKVVEPEVVKAVDDSAKWEQNKLESAINAAFKSKSIFFRKSTCLSRFNSLESFKRLDLSFFCKLGIIATSNGAIDPGHIKTLLVNLASIIAPTNLETPIP